MDPLKDEDDEVVFVEEITIKGPKSKKARKHSCKSVVGRGKMSPHKCAEPPAIKKGFVAIELGSDDSLNEWKPIAVIANTFSLSPNELHWAPDIVKTAESDTISVNSQITDWEVPVAIDEDVTGKNLVDGNNPSSTFHTDTNEPRNTNTPPTQKDVDIDSSLISESPSSICCFPIFPKLEENIEQGMHGHNETESLKKQISMLSRQISEIDQARPSCSSSIEQQQPQGTQSALPKVECVDLRSDEEVNEDGDISEDTEPNESFEQGSNTAKQLLEFNFSKLEPLTKEDITTFVSYCKHVMKIRGLIYNDFTNWSDTRGYSCSENKLSLFMNLKLGETGTRKMMFLLKQFLEDERGGLTMLSDAVESCIDKGRVAMKQKNLHNIDFLTWARHRFDLRLERSVIGNFMNKKLNERRSREILPFFLQFLNDETLKPKKRKRRDGFAPNQLSALMESFRTNPNPSQTLIQQLADHLGTTQFKVKRWFIERKHETKSKK